MNNYLSKNFRYKIIVVIFALIIVAIISFVPVLFMERIVNNSVINHKSNTLVLLFGGCYLILQLFSTFFHALTNYIIDRLQVRIGSEIQKDLFNKLLSMDFSDFD